MRVGIIGGGAVGLVQAILLQKKGAKVVLFEKLLERPSFKRIIGLDGSSLALFKELGFLEEVVALGRKIYGADVYFEEKKIAHFSLEKMSKDSTFMLTIPLSDLEEFLETKVKSMQKGVELLGVEGKTCVFKDGKKEEFDLIIGADGPNSKVREFAGISYSQYDYEISLEIASQRVEKEEKVVQMYFQKGKTCALRFPYSKDHVQVIRVLHPRQGSIDEKKMLLGENETVFNLKLDRKLASTFYKGGVLLLGDAAHHMTPFGGRGLNLSLQDARGYSDAIVDGSLFDFVKKRRKRAKKVMLETHLLAQFVGRGRRVVIWVFRFLNAFPFIFNKILSVHVNITNRKRG